MKTRFRRAILCLMSAIVLLGTTSVSVWADEPQSININGQDTAFVELFRVENGVTYLPIRLAFNNFQEQGFSVQVVPSVEKQNIAISVIKVDPETGAVDEDRRGVYINWGSDVTNDSEFEHGRLELYKYRKDADGNNYLPTENYIRPTALENALIFSFVDDNGGQRAFMSLDDLNNMVRFLIDDSNYSVKLK